MIRDPPEQTRLIHVSYATILYLNKTSCQIHHKKKCRRIELIIDYPADTYGILMQAALDQAAQAAAHGDVPVGALVAAPGNAIIGTGHNRSEYSNDPCLHAEIIALREACAALKTPRLDRCTLISTLEPCAMCAGAIVNARISRVIFAAWDLKSGAAGSVIDVLRNRLLPHTAEVIGGIREEESVALLQKFFDGKRRKNIPFIC